MFLLKPFTLTYAFLWFLFWSSDVNFIKPETVNLVGAKKNAICKNFSVDVLKKIG